MSDNPSIRTELERIIIDPTADIMARVTAGRVYCRWLMHARPDRHDAAESILKGLAGNVSETHVALRQLECLVVPLRQ